MTQLSDLLAAGFDEVIAQAGTAISGVDGGTASGILSPIVKKKALRDSGLMAEVESTAELTRSAARTVGLLDADGKPVDRARIVIGAVTFSAMVFEDDPSDPMIRVHLKRFRGA